MQTTQQRLNELQGKLTAAQAARDSAEEELRRARSDEETEAVAAVLEDRIPSSSSFAQKVETAAGRLQASAERVKTLTRAVDQTRDKLQFEIDEVKAQRLGRIKADIAPRQARVNALMDELAEESRALLLAVQTAPGWGDVVDIYSIGSVIFPPANWHDPDADLHERSIRGKVLGDLPAILDTLSYQRRHGKTAGR